MNTDLPPLWVIYQGSSQSETQAIQPRRFCL